MRLPWTLALYRRYGRRLTAGSFLRLRSAMIAERRGGVGFADEISCRVRSPAACDVRFRPASNDLYTLDEVMVEEIYRPVVEHVRDARTVIDLGANIGLASLYFAGRCPGCRILAIEPEAANYRLLSQNLAPLAARGRARTLRAAFWPADCRVEFPPPELGHVNQGTVRAVAPDTDPDSADVVPGLCARSVIRESGFEWVDLLKVDVEGAERHLFDGDTDWLRRVRCLAIEFHDQSRSESGFDRVIQGYGFVVSEANAHTVVAVAPAARA